MLRVLIHDSSDGRTKVWDISNPTLRSESFLQLFEMLDVRGAYVNLETTVEQQLHYQALQGNWKAAEALLVTRRDQPDQNYREIDVVNSGSSEKPARSVVKVDITEVAARMHEKVPPEETP